MTVYFESDTGSILIEPDSTLTLKDRILYYDRRFKYYGSAQKYPKLKFLILDDKFR